MTEKAYEQGSTYPELAKNQLRLYSMRFCPYAQRTRIVLAHYNVPHEVVNINLKKKPDWFLAKTAGLVPVLEQDDKIVLESSICDEYLDELCGTASQRLFPSDPYKKARMKYLMEKFSKVIDKFYAILRAKTEEDKSNGLLEIHAALQTFEDEIKENYFGGEELSMLDAHIWPWFERMPVVSKMQNVDILPVEKFPKLSAWIERMQKYPAIRKTWFDPETHTKFLEQYYSGGPIDYDIGLH